MTATKLDLIKASEWGIFSDMKKPLVIAGPWTFATSVAIFIPNSRCALFIQTNPSAPTPSKQFGRVRGFQIPARKMP